MSKPTMLADSRLETLDGFRVEIDRERERADIVLDRPPLNIIEMPQRDQLRLVFETILAFGLSCCGPSENIFRAAETSRVSWRLPPSMSPSLHGTLPHQRVAPSL
jgi:hypothetical protein